MQPRKTIFKTPFVKRFLIRTINTTINTEKAKIQNLKCWKTIPGPRSFPLLGQLPNFLPGGMLYNNFGYELFDTLYKHYGPIVKLNGMFGSHDQIILFDPESIEQIHRSENTMPIRPGFDSLEYYRKIYKKQSYVEDQRTGLVTDHREIWKEFRSTVNPVLLQPKTIQLYRSQLNQVAEDMVARLRSLRDDNNKIQGKFDSEMNLWALESIGMVALGGRINCLDPNLPKDSPARKLIQCIHEIMELVNSLEFRPSLWRYIPTKTFYKAMRIYEQQENLSKYFIKQAEEKLKLRGTTSSDEKGVLEKLLEIDERTAYIMATDMLFAGVDTASNTISATLYLLAKNQDKQDKLREEIVSKQIKKPYLKACLKESIRMMPVVSGNIRKTSKEYSILGYRIPKDILVTFSHQYISMMENQYPKPDEYIPERWIVDKSDPMYHGNAHPFAYNPFGFGVRSCIGRRIAELEMEIFLEHLIENFHIEWSGAPPNITSTSLNYFTGPFEFIFRDV